jgi:outer membrane protein insertion porin family
MRRTGSSQSNRFVWRDGAAWLLPVVLAVMVGLAARPSGAAEPPRIAALDVRGARTIETATILSRSGLTVGVAADPALVRDAVKAVYRMGYFDDVSIEQEPVGDGVGVTIVVSERPILTEVRYEGYDGVSLEKLKEQVTISLQTFIDLRAVNAAATKLQQYYFSEGYADARVIPVTKAGAVGAVSVTFLIEEGKRGKIRAVDFEGNKQVPRKRLRKAITTKQYFWLTSWMTNAGIYKQDELDQDAERLRDFYLNEGYVQVQIGTPRVLPLPDRKGFTVVFPIVEGERYTVDRIRLTGHTMFSTDELREGLALHEGDIFRRNLLRQDITGLTDRYGERGYAFVDIRPQFVPHPDTRGIDLTYEIREGLPVMVREITIEGNDKTYDNVIRRELRVAEQEVVNTKLLKRSFQRINNLNFFENVEILPNPIGDDQMDIRVRVKEKPTGTFSVGGGYSSVDGPVFQSDITQGNLFGRGQLLRARLEKSTRRTTNYTLTFREPYLLDRAVSGTVDLFSQERKYTTYKDGRTGGSLSLGKSFGEYVSASLSYTRETTKVFDLETQVRTDSAGNPVLDPATGLPVTDPLAPPVVVQAAERGKTTTSSVGLSVARDTRDFAFDPREGQRHSLSVEYAGGSLLRGDNRFYRVVSDHSVFFPVVWNTVFSLHLRLGYLGGIEIPFSERFVVGGINTVRGFDYGTAGRVDPSTGEIFGGNKEIIFNAEYVFPLVTEAKMKGVIFFDAGRSFDDQGRFNAAGTVLVGPDGRPFVSGERMRVGDLRYSAGFGIRMLLPIGPIRLEWGYNLDSQPGEQSGLFPEFTIGTVF